MDVSASRWPKCDTEVIDQPSHVPGKKLISAICSKHFKLRVAPSINMRWPLHREVLALRTSFYSHYQNTRRATHYDLWPLSLAEHARNADYEIKIFGACIDGFSICFILNQKRAESILCAPRCLCSRAPKTPLNSDMCSKAPELGLTSGAATIVVPETSSARCYLNAQFRCSSFFPYILRHISPNWARSTAMSCWVFLSFKNA